MKNSTTKIAIMLIGMSALFSSCDNFHDEAPSANVTAQERFAENFTGIAVADAFLVDVEYSATEESIIIEANDNLHQFIEVENVNGILRIKLRDRVNIRGNATFKAHIITKNYLDSFSASGASRMTLINPQESADVNIRLSGASFLTGEFTANSITAYLDGASNATIRGSADTFTLNADGASLIGSFEMIAGNAYLQMSGASNASLTINGEINLRASGASVLMYKGSASKNHIDLSGSSQIVKAD